MNINQLVLSAITEYGDSTRKELLRHADDDELEKEAKKKLTDKWALFHLAKHGIIGGIGGGLLGHSPNKDKNSTKTGALLGAGVGVATGIMRHFKDRKFAKQELAYRNRIRNPK